MLKNKLKKCFDDGSIDRERHKGLRRIIDGKEKSRDHLKKAINNFQVMIDLHGMKHSDWCASAAFYCLYHGLLAIISKHGYESRNQSCTFALVESFIDEQKIKILKKDVLKEIFDSDVSNNLENSTKILDIREKMQYSTKTRFEEEEFQNLKARTKELLDKIRLELEDDM